MLMLSVIIDLDISLAAFGRKEIEIAEVVTASVWMMHFDAQSMFLLE